MAEEGPSTSAPTEAANFESAIEATKFGRFNILLLILAVPSSCIPVFETTTMSYVFPIAQCQFQLTLNQKGSLNAYSFIGMVVSGFFWAFLIDTLGRKKMLVLGYLIYTVILVASAFSQSYEFLAVTKFLGGLVVNGPFSAITSYLSEFHCSKYRTRVQLVRGMNVFIGVLFLSLVAWLTLPLTLDFVLFNYFNMHAWNVFLLATSVPSVVCTVAFVFMPESPKFLMSVGRNEEALKVFRLVFSMNTRKARDLYPITELVDETKLARSDSKYGGQITAHRNKKQAMKEGCRQIRPICFPPHLRDIVVGSFLQGLAMMGMNTLRLWIPQTFQSINDYKLYHNGSTASLCTMLKLSEVKEQEKYTNGTCQVNKSADVYLNTTFVATSTAIAFMITLLIIPKLGKKIILGVYPLIAGACSLAIYFARDTVTVLILSSIFISMGSVCIYVLLAVVIDMFPTFLRTVAVALVMTSGRVATIIGSLIFPPLLKHDCVIPFSMLTVAVIISSLLVLLLPNTEKKALE